MGLANYLKGTAVVLTVAALTFALGGCGGGKKKTNKFTVPKENLPAGVISVIRPKPNKETLFVRALAQEAIRRNQVALLYNKALIHYDSEKGNAVDHGKLLKKAKAAWKSARDSASVALFYAIGLSQLERTEGYDPYQKSKAALTLPEIHLMQVAYAKEDKKKNSMEEVFSKYSPQLIRNDLKKIPESKQLLAITKMYHTSGKTACQIMNAINPDYQQTGRSFKDVVCDVGYRTCYAAKVSGKVALVGLASVCLVKTAPVLGVHGTLGAGHLIGVGVVDTLIDTLQLGHVLYTGEEHPEIKKGLVVSETASSIVNVLFFDLSKPLMGRKDIPAKNTGNLGKDLLNKTKDYFKTSGENASKIGQDIKKGVDSTKNYFMDFKAKFPAETLKTTAAEVGNNIMASEGNLNALSVTEGLIGLPENINKLGEMSSERDILQNKVLAVAARQTEDGGTETRTGLFSNKDEEKMTAKEKTEEKEILKALDTTKEEINKTQEDVKQEIANTAIASSKDLEKKAEDIANAGGAGEYKNEFDTFINDTRQGLDNVLSDSGGNSGKNLDQSLSEAADEEMKVTRKTGSDDGSQNDEQQNQEENWSEENSNATNPDESVEKQQKQPESEKSANESGSESGVDSDDAPFAIHKVIGAKGTIKEDERAKGAIKGVVHWTHHLEIIRDGKGIAVSDSWVATSGPKAKSTGKKVFKVVGFDTETGEGIVKVYERSYPLKIIESKKVMGIHIEGFCGMKNASKKI